MKRTVIALIALMAGTPVQASIQQITSKDQFARQLQQPNSVIMLNSSTCPACDMQKETLIPTARKYAGIKLYEFTVDGDEFKELRAEQKVQGYPTTLFVTKTGIKRELGNMGECELVTIFNEMTGKQPERQVKPVAQPTPQAITQPAPQAAPKTTACPPGRRPAKAA